MFTKLYLDTTDPMLKLSEIFHPRIFFPMMTSVVFHTILYIAFFNLGNYIFTGKFLSKTIHVRLFSVLIGIMFLGYFARIQHVKEIYKSYHMNPTKTREHVDKFFISWVFLG
jgi:hypothetical protein